MYHKITLIGRLGRDVELRYTEQGVPVASFSMAVDDSYGEAQKTIWIRVTVWRKQAETCNQYLRKGRQVYVEGRLNHENGNPRVYARNDGKPGASFEVTANVVKFLGDRGDGGSNGAGQDEQGEPDTDVDAMPF